MIFRSARATNYSNFFAASVRSSQAWSSRDGEIPGGVGRSGTPMGGHSTT
jgi:hypothetical protein